MPRKSRVRQQDIKVITNSNSKNDKIENVENVVDRMRNLKERNNRLQAQVWDSDRENKRLREEIRKLNNRLDAVQRPMGGWVRTAIPLNYEGEIRYLRETVDLLRDEKYHQEVQIDAMYEDISRVEYLKDEIDDLREKNRNLEGKIESMKEDKELCLTMEELQISNSWYNKLNKS
tara:strand:- start:1044 stop:1568 length:525 start_codon:yes stop_codon:yes gene_type:complete